MLEKSASVRNYFSELAAIDVNQHIEKKGHYAYLSWAWAVDQLRRYDPMATWSVKRFDGLPYLQTPCGFFVEVEVVVKGVGLSQLLPVLNAQNKPIDVPTNFNINVSIQRCLVKAIALHGLGLYLYAGEELPTVHSVEQSNAANSSSANASSPVSSSVASSPVYETHTAVSQATQPVVDSLLGEQLRQTALRGTAALKSAWEQLTSAQRKKLQPQLAHWKQTAGYVDKKNNLDDTHCMTSEAAEYFNA